jgi:propanol-preferring alcohol dehydrogenase
MRAMVLRRPGEAPILSEVEAPRPGPGEILIDVAACGVCRTDLHIVDGELPPHRSPVIPGHQPVGRVRTPGAGAERFAIGDRVGVGWLAWACGECRYCRAGQENLCERGRFTGYDVDGGYAEQMVADERFCYRIPDAFTDIAAAPLLCGGLIGYRAWRLAGPAEHVGLYGFGSAASLVLQVARYRRQRVYAFVRPGDARAREFALALGVEWAGDSNRPGPQLLDAAIIFAPAGELVPNALRAVRPGGTVVCAGIHMSDIPSFPYAILWQERVLRSVANLTRADAEEFLRLAPEIPVRTEVESYPLEAAATALDRLRAGEVRGSAVLVIGTG